MPVTPLVSDGCWIFCFWLIISPVLPSSINDPIFTNVIQRDVPNKNEPTLGQMRPLKKAFLSNRFITCNDGSQAGFYLRKSTHSKKWIIFLEGGWYCYDHHSCRNRWIKQRHYMTSSNWPETKDVGGILSPNMQENPFWWNANHVFVPYCTSDSWSGSKRPSKQGMFSFMGSSVVLQVVRDLIPLGLENSTDLLLTGSSAGGTGVMINLDFVEELLHEEFMLKKLRVKGVTDSGWFLDRTPFAPTKPAVEAIRKGMELWQGRVPRRCREQYLDEPWRCYFGYRIYPTLKAPLFVFQWLFDEAQMDADNVGAPETKQQWDYIHKMGDALRHSFQNVSAVFAPSCISHSVLTKKDWQLVKIDDISLSDALHCWEQKTNRRRIKRRKNNRRKDFQRQSNNALKNLENVDVNVKEPDSIQEFANNDNRRRRKNQRKHHRRKNKGQHSNKRKANLLRTTNSLPLTNNFSLAEHHQSRKVSSQKQRRSFNRHCVHRRLERCSWPQVNVLLILNYQ
ncbi:hypothetical protein ABEB36_012736 [Hypothenemus hampei]|uniref:Notum n=1 Tax=Hypothenemus hampei TaxID=57062 RepID=A0ABD1ECH8_HYPHA